MTQSSTELKYMKKTIAILSAAVLALTAFADDIYTKTFSSRPDATFQYQFFEHNNSIMDSLLVKKDASMTFALTSNKAGASTLTFGFYTFDSSGNILSSESFDMLSGQSYTANFSQGDMVAFWLDMGNGRIDSLVDYTHADILDSGKSLWASHASTGENTNALTLHVKDRGISKTGDVTLTINGGAPMSASPSGQPMPGVLATLLIAGAGVVCLRMRRRAK